jgi:hypothetical protein
MVKKMRFSPICKAELGEVDAGEEKAVLLGPESSY